MKKFDFKILSTYTRNGITRHQTRSGLMAAPSLSSAIQRITEMSNLNQIFDTEIRKSDLHDQITHKLLYIGDAC